MKVNIVRINRNGVEYNVTLKNMQKRMNFLNIYIPISGTAIQDHNVCKRNTAKYVNVV